MGDQKLLATIKGKRLSAAVSSLTQWSCEMDGDSGLVLRAIEGPTGPQIESAVVNKSELPQDSDAVCHVDWGWIADSVVDDIVASASSVRLLLAPAGPLTISVQTWQGKPFLAFQPYKAMPH